MKYLREKHWFVCFRLSSYSFKK